MGNLESYLALQDLPIRCAIWSSAAKARLDTGVAQGTVETWTSIWKCNVNLRL